METLKNNPHAGSSFDEYHNECMKDPEFNKEYGKLQLQRRMAVVIEAKRKEKCLSQKELAERANTTQSFISRIENGNVSLGMSTLQKIANALESKINIVLD